MINIPTFNQFSENLLESANQVSDLVDKIISDKNFLSTTVIQIEKQFNEQANTIKSLKSDFKDLQIEMSVGNPKGKIKSKLNDLVADIHQNELAYKLLSRDANDYQKSLYMDAPDQNRTRLAKNIAESIQHCQNRISNIEKDILAYQSIVKQF